MSTTTPTRLWEHDPNPKLQWVPEHLTHVTTILEPIHDQLRTWTGEEIVTTNFIDAEVINRATGARVHILHGAPDLTESLKQLQTNADKKLIAFIVDGGTDRRLTPIATKLGMRIIHTQPKNDPKNPMPLTTIEEQEGIDSVRRMLLPPAAPTRSTVLRVDKLTPMTFGDGVYCIRSPQGTGKTHMISTLSTENEDDGILSVSHLVSLVRHMGSTLGLRQYDDPTAWIDLSATEEATPHGSKFVVPQAAKRLATTMHSLHKLMVGDHVTPYHTIIIDESEQVLRSLAGNMSHKAAVIQVLKYLMKHAQRIILMDADLGDLTLKVVKRWLPKSKPVIITNKPPTKIMRRMEILEDINEPYARILHALRDNERIYVYSNSKKLADNVDAFIERHSPTKKRLLITAESSRSPEVRDFLADTRNHDYDVIIASPAVSTGVSVDDPRIERVIGFIHTNVNTANDVIQAVNRPRHARSVELYVNPRHDTKPTSREAIMRKWIDGDRVERHLVGVDENTGEIGYKDADYEFIYVEVKRFENIQLNSLKGSLIRFAEKAGYSVVVTPRNGSVHDGLAIEARLMNRERAARVLMTTETVSESRATSLLVNWYRTESESRELMKFGLLRDYGLLELGGVSDEERDELLVNWSVYGPRLEFVDNLGDSFFSVNRAWKRLVKQTDVHRPDVDRSVLKRELFSRVREAVGLTHGVLLQFFKSGELPDLGRYSATSVGVVNLVKFVSEYHGVLSSVLDLPRLGLLRESPIRFLGLLLARLGLRQKRVGKNARGLYSLDRDVLVRTLKIAVARFSRLHRGVRRLISSVFWVRVFGAREVLNDVAFDELMVV